MLSSVSRLVLSHLAAYTFSFSCIVISLATAALGIVRQFPLMQIAFGFSYLQFS